MTTLNRGEEETIQLNSLHQQQTTESCVTPDDDVGGGGGGSEMSDVIMDTIRPAIVKFDEQVKNTRKSQILLANLTNEVSSCEFFIFRFAF